MAYLVLILASTCSVVASVVLKMAGQAPNLQLINLQDGFRYILAIACYGTGFVFYALSLRQLDLTLAYPLMVAMSILGIFAYGAFSGTEQFGWVRLAGAAMVATGAFLLIK